MSFFDGLHFYEIVLLVLGGLLFLVLLFAFLFSLLKGKPLGGLLLFFFVPIVMIGFPGIDSIRINNGIIEIEKKTRQIELNPTDKGAREELERAVQKVSTRQFSNPQTLITVARAQMVLGNEDKAQSNVEKALTIDPKSAEASRLKKKIELVNEMDKLTQRVEQNPFDEAAKLKLRKKVGEVTQQPVSSPTTLTKIARAQAVLGESDKALSNVEKVLTIDPKSAEAIKLKSRIKTQ